ncbi:MAG TPA: membrane protein insertase YidC [Candidatus Cloacimonadota bacterium]|nr:membrane protein insertase YidC [Candidatus Cloacimonadota bacterium]
MDKRTLTALLLMFILFLVFQQYVWKPKPVAQTQPTPSEQPAQAAQPAADSLPKPGLALPDSLIDPNLEAAQIILSNQVMKVSFSSRGAVIQQVEMKDHKVDKATPVRLIPPDSGIAGLKVFYPATQSDLSGAVFNYRVSADSSKIDFWLGDEANPKVKRSYSLDSGYGIGMKIRIDNLGTIHGLGLDFGAGIADSETYTKYKAQDYKFVYYANNEIKKTTLASLKKKPAGGKVNTFRWAALRSKYFSIAVKENEPYLTSEFQATVNPKTGNPSMELASKSSSGKLIWEQDYLVYAGPADYDLLSGYNSQMQNVAERGPGWLRWLANLIAGFLKFLHGFIPNYGVVIIVFSMILSVILTSIQHPLTRKGMEANLKMQAIQPHMDAIRKRYPNDMNAQRVEMAKLQKEHGVNMFGGCIMWVPLLFNMPILISLYSVLRYTLDMRNASFVLWWQDLSLPDKYYVLPILMGATMVIQSRFMKPPSPPEDQMTEQQKQAQQMGKTMNLIMPVMMFFIFRGLPAGLVLYYTVYSIFAAIQQYHLQKKFRNKDTVK